MNQSDLESQLQHLLSSLETARKNKSNLEGYLALTTAKLLPTGLLEAQAAILAEAQKKADELIPADTKAQLDALKTEVEPKLLAAQTYISTLETQAMQLSMQIKHTVAEGGLQVIYNPGSRQIKNWDALEELLDPEGENNLVARITSAAVNVFILAVDIDAPERVNRFTERVQTILGEVRELMGRGKPSARIAEKSQK